MRYEKPIVMDLGAGARFAGGQGPLSCLSGDTPGGVNVCDVGTNGGTWSNTCEVGPVPGSNPPPNCYSGSSPIFCEAGAGGFGGGDICTVGPSDQP
jgi:hypothetical protein